MHLQTSLVEHLTGRRMELNQADAPVLCGEVNKKL